MCCPNNNDYSEITTKILNKKDILTHRPKKWEVLQYNSIV